MEDTTTPTSLLAIMPNTKDEINSFADKLLTQIGNGEIDPLKIHVQLKAVETVIKRVNDNTFYKTAIRNASEMYGGKNFEAFGAKVELAEVGTKYNFDNCGHVYYNDVIAKISELEKQKKEYETLLKAIKEATPMIFDGEGVNVYPPIKTSTSSIKVSF